MFVTTEVGYSWNKMKKILARLCVLGFCVFAFAQGASFQNDEEMNWAEDEGESEVDYFGELKVKIFWYYLKFAYLHLVYKSLLELPTVVANHIHWNESPYFLFLFTRMNLVTRNRLRCQYWVASRTLFAAFVTRLAKFPLMMNANVRNYKSVVKIALEMACFVVSCPMSVFGTACVVSAVVWMTLATHWKNAYEASKS